MKKLITIQTFIFFLFVSCVGTIEDKNPETTKNTKNKSLPVSFNGLTRAVPVSHDKVELYFFPATGKPEDLVYLIYINNGQVPLEVKSNAFFTDPSGAYVYTVNDLRVNTTYSFAVGVRDLKNGSESNDNSTLFATTFLNRTANFKGATSAAPASGENGQTQIVVNWISAEVKGTSLAKSEDPVAYDVRYMKASDGSPNLLFDKNNSAVTSLPEPSSLGGNPVINKDSSRTITGLSPDTQYYFLVRCIHKDYVNHTTDINYKLEENTKVVTARTLSSDGDFAWNNQSVKLSTPLGSNGLTQIDVSWDGATGPFREYRLYIEKVGDTDADENNLPGSLTDADISSMNVSNDYTIIDASAIGNRVTGLDSYAYYDIRIAACKNVSCDLAGGNALISDSLVSRIVPRIAPFNGLVDIQDPTDNNSPDVIKLKFDSPVVSAGYLSELRVYCYDGKNDSGPVELEYNTAYDDGDAGNDHICEGITRSTPIQSISSYPNFEEIELQAASFVPSDNKTITDDEFCFSIVPVVSGTDYMFEDVTNAVVKCQRIRIRVPTITQFPGLNNSCSSDTSSLTVSWNAPNGGLFDQYELFYKEDNGQPFSFAEALDSGHPNNGDYTSIETSNTQETIASLFSGRNYQLGVLTYLEDDSNNKIYSELNAGIVNCQTKLPGVRFDEWVDLFAVGPKVDGRIPKDSNGRQSYMLETLNQFAQPIEVQVASLSGAGTGDGLPDYSVSTNFTNKFEDISLSVMHDGTYGAYSGVAGNGLARYSNSGIVRLVWNDVYFEGDTNNTMSAKITEVGDDLNAKSDRQFGYKVYRSVDGGNTWIDLTDEDFDYQDSANAGLIHPVSNYQDRNRVNSFETKTVGIFTDYSVRHFEDDAGVARAREYYYRIIPVFDGKELNFEREDSNPQHTIKVLLPPPNMAFVSRLMANRQACKEIGKSYSKDLRDYYTCTYNGLGATSLSKPSVVGQTVYDLGGDLLIDRYELGCNYTRGDKELDDSVYTGDHRDFDGYADNNQKFKGCLISQDASAAQEKGSFHPSEEYDSYSQFFVGDCTGEGFEILSRRSDTCGDGRNTYQRNYHLPGLHSGIVSSEPACTLEDELLINLLDPYSLDNGDMVDFAAHSENLAVYYYRSLNNQDRYAYEYRGANNDTIDFQGHDGYRASSCAVNIPVEDSNGKIYSRWLPVNHLAQLRHDGDNVDILDNTVSEIEQNNDFFDNSNNKVLSVSELRQSDNQRYVASTPIAKVFSSNNAKLPPLDGLSQSEFNRVCQAYEIEVGQAEDDGTSYVRTREKKQKRLMRRTEGIIASAHPKAFNETTANNIELGSHNTNFSDSGSFSDGCNTYEREANMSDQDIAEVESGAYMKTTYVEYNSIRPAVLTGSSLFDPFSHNPSDLDEESYNDQNTQGCTSRYGVQDLIGNVSEFSSENFACDYQEDKLWLTLFNLIGNRDKTQSIPYSSINSGNGNGYDRIYKLGELGIWRETNVNSGRCSVYRAGSDRDGVPFLASNGVTMTPIFNDFGELNTSLIQIQTGIDQLNLDYLRSGDGILMDYGEGSFLPPLSKNDALALQFSEASGDPKIERVQDRRDAVGSSDPRRGRFFNPIIGFPLLCGENSCDQADDDNTKITTAPLLALNADLDSDDVEIDNFPTGNSQIYSDGMSEVISDQVIYREDGNGQRIFNYIDSIDAKNDTDESNDEYTTDAGDEALNTGEEYARTYFRTDRGATLFYLNFGSSKLPGSGRYTAEQKGQTDFNQGAFSDVGARCAVKFQ